ncbi:hypothetical protein ACO0SA_002385 [Hanseniaspora valbyensis]
MFRYNKILNRSILITGSTKGLGNNLARRFIKNEKYDTLFIHGSSKETVTNSLTKILQEHNNLQNKHVIGVVCDFGLGNDQDNLVVELIDLNKNQFYKLDNFKSFLQQYPLDDIILNHAISQEKLFIKLNNIEINKLLNINIISYLQLANSVLNNWLIKNLKTKNIKTITTIGSILNDFEKQEIKGNSIYAMSKKNVEMLSQVLSLEYGSRYKWLKIMHHNIPLLTDSSLVSNKVLLEKMNVKEDTIENVSKKIYNELISQNLYSKYKYTSYNYTNKMIIYKDIISDDELLSDAYDVNLVDGVIYEADCDLIKVGNGDVDIGANPSAEDAEDDLEEGQEIVNNVVYSFRLQQTAFDKKSFLTYIKGYMKSIKKQLEETDPEAVSVFEKGAQAYVKKIVGSFKDWEFFTGESMNPDGMVVLLNYREDGTTPYVAIWKHGVSAEKI